LKTEKGNSFKRVWSGDLFATISSSPEGPQTFVSEIEFKDLDSDNNSEVIQKGKVISCQLDDCLCREGPVQEESQKIFKWNNQTQNFVEKSY